MEVKCKDPTCSSHGTCIKGTCHCEERMWTKAFISSCVIDPDSGQEGWSSQNCGVPTGTCSVDCQHGSCNATTRSCDCEEGYTGTLAMVSSALKGPWARVFHGEAVQVIGVEGCSTR